MFQYPQTALHYNTPNAAAVSPYAPGSPTSTQQYRGNEVAARLYSSSGSPTNYPPPNKHTTAPLVMNSGTLQNYDVRHMNSPNYERSGPVGPQTTESSIYSSAIPTANLIHTPEAVTLSTQQLLNDICSTSPGDNATIMQQEDCENDYPHLALDLTKVKNQFGQPVIPGKQKSREKSSSTIAREGNLANRVSSGKPLHPYTAMFNDPVEKELERWHNMHNSTVKWQRVKRGVYTADGQEVLLVKLNGCLYVKGFNPNNKLDHTAIDNFVQSMQGGNNI
ncbi:hypothetical protein X943_002626 [Babesia divergens]|uniref:Uncharacterized protein n=1 Tax=Babesia divergens TaxID=32595 RepID=A0AAD9GDC3_BABDI|nr:hypothetical protein X943_002626 [Babesia divergens]